MITEKSYIKVILKLSEANLKGDMLWQTDWVRESVKDIQINRGALIIKSDMLYTNKYVILI